MKIDFIKIIAAIETIIIFNTIDMIGVNAPTILSRLPITAKNIRYAILKNIRKSPFNAIFICKYTSFNRLTKIELSMVKTTVKNRQFIQI